MAESNGQRNIVFGTGNLLTLTFITFLVLKLTGVINWSWWWVTAPLWIGAAFLISFLLILLVIGAIIAFIAAWADK